MEFDLLLPVVVRPLSNTIYILGEWVITKKILNLWGAIYHNFSNMSRKKIS